MNELLKLMQTRRSVRKYTGEAVPAEKLEAILQSALLSPSGKGAYPFDLVVVEDRATLDKLADCRVGASRMLEKAGAAVVVLGDSAKSDTIIEDCSIVLTSMHLMAHALGLGSCWIQGRLRQAPDGRSTEEYLREILGFPETHRLEAILSIGVPAEAPAPHALEALDSSRVHREKF